QDPQHEADHQVARDELRCGVPRLEHPANHQNESRRATTSAGRPARGCSGWALALICDPALRRGTLPYGLLESHQWLIELPLPMQSAGSRPKRRSAVSRHSGTGSYSHTLMYATVEAQRQEHRRLRRLVNGIGSLSGTGVAIAAAAGIPLVWIWIASKLAGTKRDLTPSLAVFIATGIIVSYCLPARKS